MIRFLFTFFLALAAIPFSVSAQQPAPSPSPVVLELFTSQACAFCPPADALMGQMIQQENIIGLSCHVDYFGVKKNSLGKSFCTRRQNEYGRLIGTGPRYTPQLVVNGHMDMIGYETGRVSAAVMKARAEKIASIALAPAGNGSYSFTLPQVNTGRGEVRLWLAIYDAPKSIAMTEGNNFGKKLTYYNVVSQINDLGVWDGAPMARSVDVGFAPSSAGMAVIAQNVKTGKIIAAGSARRDASIPVARAQ
jgi:hypothetical protein